MYSLIFVQDSSLGHSNLSILQEPQHRLRKGFISQRISYRRISRPCLNSFNPIPEASSAF